MLSKSVLMMKSFQIGTYFTYVRKKQALFKTAFGLSSEICSLLLLHTYILNFGGSKRRELGENAINKTLEVIYSKAYTSNVIS